MSVQKWRVTDSKYLIQDRWLNLRVDTCHNSSVEIAPYYVFEYSPWVTVVPVTTNNELVLIRQYRHGTGTIEIELPGGGVEPGDPSISDAACRELIEETGYVGDNFIEIAKVSPNTSSHNNYSHVVLARDVSLQTSQALDSTEEIEVFTLPIREVPDYIAQGVFRQAMHVAALHYALSHMGLLKFQPH